MVGDIMTYTIKIKWDPEAEMWIAICDDPCIALEARSYDVLVERVKVALLDALEEIGESNCKAIKYQTEDFQLAYA